MVIPVAVKKSKPFNPSGGRKRLTVPVDPESVNPVGLRLSVLHAMEGRRDLQHQSWVQTEGGKERDALQAFLGEAERRQSISTPSSKTLPLAAIRKAFAKANVPWHERWRLCKLEHERDAFILEYRQRLKKRRQCQHRLNEVEACIRAEQEDANKHAVNQVSAPVPVSGGREDIWRHLVRKEIPRVAKQLAQNVTNRLSNLRRLSGLAARAARRLEGRRARQARDVQLRAKRAMREMLAFWRRNEREEREARKKAEREALEKQRQEEEAREARRQARKLDFLLTQTELYSHFIGSKVRSTEEAEVEVSAAPLDFAEASDDAIRAEASRIAQRAAQIQLEKTASFDKNAGAAALSLAAPKAIAEDVQQPRMLQAQLKPYQLIGLRWLANLYEQGINGILADEMGLGKTIQAISLLAYLAEAHSLWGPFLIVAPASTLHNWQQELERFVPSLRVIPYWGNVSDRKTLRRLLNPKRLYSRDSPFHILVTSYQLVSCILFSLV